ncbi:hypothetical protein GH714_005121 [Hevea brasiliensis]|uniref:Retrotransposon gag domain-containing protein n=1 Tax=Hevea brasiliensis TaxID=3981 RepID=A0A6A6KZ62_HEVBR|nr:hypothetical protein GH714_005121 [Hevea brasiliensis]
MAGISLQYNDLATSRGHVGTSQAREFYNSGYNHSWSRFPKLDFPHFSGDDLESWLIKVEYYFEVIGTLMEKRVKITAMHLDGKAVQWHQGYVKVKCTKAYGRWDEYVQGLKARFGIQLPNNLTSKQFNEKRDNGLYFWCDEKFLPGHKWVHVAKKLRCDVEPVSGVSVEVTKGQNMQCHAKCNLSNGR